jgi:putative methanogenesis marker protein 1
MMNMLSCLEKTKLEKDFFGETRRICSPKDTFERIKSFFPVMGITRIANVTGLDRLGIPVYTACRPNSRSLSVSQGKGYTHDAAKASAVMESIETYHAETIQSPLKLCSYNELRFSDNVVNVACVSKPKDSVFTANQRLLWVEGVDLFSQQKKWVPYETVHLDYRTPLLSGQGCFTSSSNGLSSGNHYHESIIHGLCEVIERDALTLWSLKDAEQQMADKIDLGTIDDLRCRDIIGRFMGANIEVGIWDITSSIGIPAFLCRILPNVESDMSGIRPASGMGCHLSKDIALLRAITEAAQSRLTFISGGRDDLKREDYTRFLSIEEYYKWHRLIVCASEPLKNYRAIKGCEGTTFNSDLNALLGALRSNGILEAIVIDLTKEEFKIPVTRVVVPGLESFLSSTEIIFGQRAGRVLQQGRS